jgi:predicted Zn-dependent protease
MAQLNSNQTAQVTIRVVGEERAAVRQGLQLRISNATGASFMAYTNADGIAQVRLPVGTYAVTLYGTNADVAGESNFVIVSGQIQQNEELKLVRTPKPGATGDTVAVAELRMSDDARKQLTKALKQLAKQDFAGAAPRLRRLGAEYPDSAVVQNGLGVIAMHDGDRSQAQACFSAAIHADARFTPAYINLGRVLLMAKDIAGGEKMLQHAVELEPANPEAMSLLAYMQLLHGRSDAAIATAMRVHSMRHDRYAMVHFVAANAYEQKDLRREAANEYRQYIREAPDGLSVDRARTALARIESGPR